LGFFVALPQQMADVFCILVFLPIYLIFVCLNFEFMKKMLLILGCLMITAAVKAQNQEVKPATKGTVYGTMLDRTDPVSVNDFQKLMRDNRYDGMIAGKVSEVSLTDGAWFRLEKRGGGTLLVQLKGFSVPKDMTGKSVAVEGTASVQKVLENGYKQVTNASGKSKANSKVQDKQLILTATGVRVL
jgi:hypothetical protein